MLVLIFTVIASSLFTLNRVNYTHVPHFIIFEDELEHLHIDVDLRCKKKCYVHSPKFQVQHQSRVNLIHDTYVLTSNLASKNLILVGWLLPSKTKERTVFR